MDDDGFVGEERAIELKVGAGDRRDEAVAYEAVRASLPIWNIIGLAEEILRTVARTPDENRSLVTALAALL